MLLDLQAAIPAAQGLSQERIDTALEHERAVLLADARNR
jgi:hypothetical protein